MTNNTDVLIKQESKKEVEQVTRFTQGLNLRQQDLFLTFLRGVEFGTFMATKRCGYITCRWRSGRRSNLAAETVLCPVSGNPGQEAGSNQYHAASVCIRDIRRRYDCIKSLYQSRR